MLRDYDRQRIIWESSLNTNQKITLLALNSLVDANGECCPGQELLSRMTGLSDRTIRNVCKSLEAKGVVQRSHRVNEKGHRTSDKYKVSFTHIPGPAPTEKSSHFLPDSIPPDCIYPFDSPLKRVSNPV